MTSTNCPFKESELADSCFILKQRIAIGSTSPCAFDSACKSAKKIIAADPNMSLTLIKKALTSSIPEMVLTAPMYKQQKIYNFGENQMDYQTEQFKNVTKAELEKQLLDTTYVTSNALSVISDLIHLNISTIQKSLHDSNEAIQQILHASDPQSLMSSLSSQQETAKESAIDYTKKLSEIALQVKEKTTESINENMSYLAERMQHFLGKINSQDPTWLSYTEQYKASLATAQSAFTDLAQKAHDFQTNPQKIWPGTDDDHEKNSTKKSKK